MTSASHSHPERAELMAFGLGKLEPAVAENIESHLEQCPSCCDTLLNLGDDTFADLVRKSSAAAATAQTMGAAPIRPTLDDSARGAIGVGELPRELREHARYEIVKLLGRGGMGDVFLAQHKLMNRPVALKVIKPELVRNDAAVRRFQREVQAAARLHHKHIVAAYDAEQAGNLHFLVMEYVDGVNLDEVVRSRGALPVEEACDFIAQAAEGLQHAHELGMVHRDIKPHNLMLSNTGVVKILDFGLANFANEVAAEESLSAAGEHASEPASLIPGASILALTQMGTMMGTPDYIAPEQAKDAHAADIRADIYSLGCTFFTLLTGEAPFGKGSVLEKIKAHSEREAPRLSELRSDVPAEVEAVLQRMMAKDPNDRYQTPQEVVDALTKLIDERIDERLRRHGIGEPPMPPKPRTVEDAGGRPDYVAWLLGLTLLVAIIAGVVFYATNDGTLIIETDDRKVEIAIDQKGKRIRVFGDERHNDPIRVKLRAGEYELKILASANEMALSENKVVIRRGGEEVIRVRLTGVAGSPFKQAASNEPIAVTLMKDGRYVLNDSPAKDANEFTQRLKEMLADNPDREVAINCHEEFGVEPVQQLWALVRQTGAKRVSLPAWVGTDLDPQQPSRFLASLGDLQAIVRKHIDEYGGKIDGKPTVELNGLNYSARVGGVDVQLLKQITTELKDKAKAAGASLTHQEDRERVSSLFGYVTPSRRGDVAVTLREIPPEQGMNWRLQIEIFESPKSGLTPNEVFVYYTKDDAGATIRLDGERVSRDELLKRVTEMAGRNSRLQVLVDGSVTPLGWDMRTLMADIAKAGIPERNVRFAPAATQRLMDEALETGKAGAPSEFFQSLGDLQAIVRKALDDEGLMFSEASSPSGGMARGPRRELFLKAEVTGQQEREGKIFSTLTDKLRGLAKASDAFISKVSQSGQGPIDRYHMSYTTDTREGTLQLERVKLRADKRMPAIWTWTVIVRVEEWPRSATPTASQPPEPPGEPSKFLEFVADTNLEEAVREQGAKADPPVEAVRNGKRVRSNPAELRFDAIVAGRAGAGPVSLDYLAKYFSQVAESKDAKIDHVGSHDQENKWERFLSYQADQRTGLVHVTLNGIGLDTRQQGNHAWTLKVEIDEWPRTQRPSPKHAVVIVFGAEKIGTQWVKVDSPAYSASGDAKGYLPNIREAIRKNPGLPVLLDIAEGVDLTDPKIAEGFEEVRRVAEETGAKIRLAPNQLPR